jgi:hypothetical protein
MTDDFALRLARQGDQAFCAQAGQLRKVVFYTDPLTGCGVPCNVLATDYDGTLYIELIDGRTGLATLGDLYAEDESGRYLGAPAL